MFWIAGPTNAQNFHRIKKRKRIAKSCLRLQVQSHNRQNGLEEKIARSKSEQLARRLKVVGGTECHISKTCHVSHEWARLFVGPGIRLASPRIRYVANSTHIFQGWAWQLRRGWSFVFVHASGPARVALWTREKCQESGCAPKTRACDQQHPSNVNCHLVACWPVDRPSNTSRPTV